MNKAKIDNDVELAAEETVSVKKSVLNEMMARLDKLENKDDFDPTEEIKIHTCRVKMWDNKPVSLIFGVHKVGKDVVTGNDKLECGIEVIGDNGDIETIEKVDYLELVMSAPVVVAEIVRRIDKDASQVFGKISIMRLEGMNMVNTGVKIPMRVNAVTTEYEVRLPGAEKTIILKEVYNI